MYYPDLSNECQLDIGTQVRAVGWLSNDHPFTKGDVPSDSREKLIRHISEAWQPVIAAGLHFCELCDEKPFACGTNLWIPTEELLYIAPGMISHYIEVHGYKPPEEFIQAVIDCPVQGSVEFLKLVERYARWRDRV